MAGNNNDLKGFTMHAGIRVALGIIIVTLLTYGAHKAFDLYQKHLLKDSAENIESSQKSEIEKKFPDIIAKETVKPGYLGPKDGIERYLGESPKKVAINKNLQRTLFLPKGLVSPMEYELDESFFGWRPNDLINKYLSFMAPDDKENFQLGILYSTRIYTKILLDKLSRKDKQSPENPDLKNAYDSFMVDEERYIGPSAELKYRKAIKYVYLYGDKVKDGGADFYVNPENLDLIISTSLYLLKECESLLRAEGDLSTFEADNRFYYSKGVSTVVLSVLKGIKADFSEAIVVVNDTNSIDKALANLELALSMSPFIITEGGLDGILANHRSNLAGLLSNSRENLGSFRDTLSKKLILNSEEEKTPWQNEDKTEKKDDKGSGLLKNENVPGEVIKPEEKI